MRKSRKMNAVNSKRHRTGGRVIFYRLDTDFERDWEEAWSKASESAMVECGLSYG